LPSCGDTGDDSADTTLAPTTPTAAPTTTTSTAIPVASAWSQVPDDEAILGGASDQSMWDVTRGGPGLVAVGMDESVDGDAAVWTSADGISWVRVPHDEAVFGGGGFQRMGGVTVGGPGLVAVGRDDVGGNVDAAVWTSADGISWVRVPDDEAVFGGAGAQLMWDVTVGGPGLVAVGSSYNDAAVWTSPDGMKWTPVPHDEVVFGGVRIQEMESIASGEPGLVAVGWDESGEDTDGAVWTSADGISWVRVPDDEAVFGGEGVQTINYVIVGGPGLVAVGMDGPDDNINAAVWTSPDGITWTQVPPDESSLGGDGEQSMWGVTRGGPGLVAVGMDESVDGDAAVWTSADGISWVRVPHDAAVFGSEGDQIMWRVTTGGLGLVGVGWDESGGDRDAAVWTTGD
jgi:hypothetical protein